MAQELNIEQKLNDLLETHNFHPEFLGKDGRPVKDASTAKTFSFDYIGSSGNNYGTMVIVLGDDNEMFVMYGDNLGKTIEDHKDRNEFFEFQHTLTNLAHRNRWHATLTDISKLKHIQAGIAAITEGLFEGYYGNKRVSYAGEPTEARLMLKHNRVLGENDARFRYVESIFIETADGERFKLPFTNLGGGRAMLEHVKQGGKPYDIRGNHICEMVGELKVLSRFNRASAGRVMEGVTQEIVEQAKTYYKNLREHIKRMSTHRGYSTYFESWHPAESVDHEKLVEDIKTMFIEQTLDTRIEDALPLLARIQQGNVMKEADIFESWIDHLSEGTWNLPETPEQLTRLKQLMSKELIVGPDATNATEQLYDLVGDDMLFDRLIDLADRDPRANAWDDTEVMSRLSELGIQTPESDTMAQPESDPAVADPMAAPGTGQQPPVAEGALNELSVNTLSSYGKKAEKSNAKMLDKAAGHSEKATNLYDKGTASAVAKSYDHEDQANNLHKQVNKRDASMDQAAGKLKKYMSKGVAEGEGFSGAVEQKVKKALLQHYGKGTVTFSKTSNGGYFARHEDDLFGDTHSHQYDPETGKIDSAHSSSQYNEEGMAEGVNDDAMAGLQKTIDFAKQHGYKIYRSPTGRKMRFVNKTIDHEIRARVDNDGDSINVNYMDMTNGGSGNDDASYFDETFKRAYNEALSDYEYRMDNREERTGMAEGENFATFEDIHSLTKLAGIPVAESRLMDATGETIDHILDRFKHEVRNFETTGDLDDDLYHALYDYYSNNGDMPYGTMKARTGDPYEWVSDHLAKHLGMNEGVLGTVGGAMLGSVMGPVGAAVGGVGGQEMTKGGSGIVEGSCNQTMEGEYCPEHGLAECGMAEGADDTSMGMLGKMVGAGIPKPSDFAAGFNKTFESRESDVLLARIKALALIR